MGIKAVHLELAADVSTDTFIAALSRFQSTSGVACDIFDYNGTNLKEANRTLTDVHQMSEDQTVFEKLIS